MPDRSFRNRLLLFCIGLFAGTAFCMTWMESDLVSGGQAFSIIGVELTYGSAELKRIFSQLTESARSTLGYHLVFDYLFMAAVYPGLAILCLMARDRHRAHWLSSLLVTLAVLQLLAWGCDVYENRCISRWMAAPSSIGDLHTYHALVGLKWILALTAFVVSLLLLLKKRSRPSPSV